VAGGGALLVGQTGTADGATVSSGGWEVVSSGGSATNTTVDSGGTLLVLPGGSATATTGSVLSTGVVEAISGSTFSALGSAASGLTISATVAYPAAYPAAPGATELLVLQGGTADGVTVASGGVESVFASGTALGGTVASGGVMSAVSGLVSGSVVSGGTASIGAGALASSATVEAGGSLDVQSGGSLDGVVIGGGGTMVLNTGAAAGGGILFSGSGGRLIVGAGSGTGEDSSFSGAIISGFTSGDTIEVVGANLPRNTLFLPGGDLLQVPTYGETLDLSFDPRQDFAGLVFAASATSNGNEAFTLAPAPIVACFAAGTRIRTDRGEVPVEALRTDDRVVLARGGTAVVRWLGHRRVDCRRHPKPVEVWPVRVAAGAFGVRQPSRDLFLSPDHAVFVGGVLIPVRYLVNGATIAQAALDAVTYWHVELPEHAVLLAEGLPCESFLDTGNRGAFANGGGATMLHAAFARAVWAAQGCAPLVLEGPALVKARRRLLARAARLGYRDDTDPALAVWANSVTLPVVADGAIRGIRVPDDARDVRLVSRVWVPADSQPEAADTRTLGVAISRVWLDGRAASLDSPALAAGWHPGEGSHRWTDGNAAVAVRGARTLAFEVAMTGHYWRAPARRSGHRGAGVDAGLRRFRCALGV
jgi:autotransporter passenger strand-loop-strand repeat protein